MAKADREQRPEADGADGAGPGAAADDGAPGASAPKRARKKAPANKAKAPRGKKAKAPGGKKAKAPAGAKARAGKKARPATGAAEKTNPRDADPAAGGKAEPVEAEVVWDSPDDSEALDREPDDEDFDAGDDDDVIDVRAGVTLPSAAANAAPTGPSLPARRGNALDRFLAEVGRYPVLSPDEERELTLAYWERQDPQAARKLVVHNLRLVVKMAYKYRRAWANVLDLIQEGNVGLVEAVRRFDPFKGAKFSTYATFWIRAYMLRYLLEHSRMVRISRTRVGRKLFFQLAKERSKLQAQGIDPGPKLLAERLGVDQEELENVVRHMDQAEVRLDAPIGDEGTGGSILDAMTSEGATPEAEAYRREITGDISRALDAFAEQLTDPREKEAWDKHLMSEDPVSLSELGQQFGVTKQRMGQIVSALRKRLRDHLIATLGPDVELGFQLEGE